MKPFKNLVMDSFSFGAVHPLETVQHLDLKKYMGDWHVIANIPNWIEKDVISSVESYDLRKDGQIDNRFVGFKKNGEKVKLTARAQVEDKDSNSIWSIRFNWDGFLGKITIPLRFNYSIIDLDPVNYSYTVVGHPSRRLLWIMARKASIEESVYLGIIQRAEKQGFDASKIVRLPQK